MLSYRQTVWVFCKLRYVYKTRASTTSQFYIDDYHSSMQQRMALTQAERVYIIDVFILNGAIASRNGQLASFDRLSIECSIDRNHSHYTCRFQ